MPVEHVACKLCNDTGFAKRVRGANGETITASPQGSFFCNAPGCTAARKVSKPLGS